MHHRFPHIVSLSGTGSGIVGLVIFDGDARGILNSLVIREKTGGLATSATSIWFCHTVSGLSLTVTPPGEQVLTLVENLILTAHATDASLASPINFPQSFRGGLAVIADIVASGSFNLQIMVDVDKFGA